MRRTSLLCALLAGASVLSAAEMAVTEPKYSAYVRIGSSTGIARYDASAADAGFSGINAVCNAVVTWPDFVAGAQAKIKLTGGDTYKDTKTSSSWEKAYLGWSLPVYRPLRLWLGHGMPLYLPGSYLAQLEVVSAGARWAKDGAALQLRLGAASFALSFTSGTTSYALYQGIKAGSAVQADFSPLGLPVEAGVSLLLDNYDETAGGFSVGKRDWTAALFARAKAGRLLTATGGYCINGAPVPVNTTFKWVEYYSKASASTELSHSHVVTCNTTWRLGRVTVEEEAEGAASFDGGYRTAYTTLRMKVPAGKVLLLAPGVQYFAVLKDGASGMNRDCFVAYPRVYLTKGSHQFSFGTKIEHREMAADSYHWIIKIPAYYRYTV